MKKIGFFKRLKMAIFELENYIEFTNEKLGKALFFGLKIVLILSLIMAISDVIYVYAGYNSPQNFVNSIVPEFSYENSKMIIEEDITKSDEKKAVAATLTSLTPAIIEVMGNSNFNKTDLVSFIAKNEVKIVMISAITIFIANILDLYIYWIMIALLTSLVGWFVLRFSRVKMKYSKLFALSIYASTLSIILTVIYTMCNSYAGIYIELFDYLSILIAYVYITAVIYMIRSDLVKQQLELIRIATVQAKVKEKIEEENEKEKEKEKKKEEENQEEKNKKQDEKKEKDDDNGYEDDEPDGSEI